MKRNFKKRTDSSPPKPAFHLKKKMVFLVIEARRLLLIHPRAGTAHLQQTSVFPRKQGRQILSNLMEKPEPAQRAGPPSFSGGSADHRLCG